MVAYKTFASLIAAAALALLPAASLAQSLGPVTQAKVTVTTGSTTILAANTATSFVKLCIASTAANGAWVQWDGATAAATSPAEYVAPGVCAVWVKSTGFLPSKQINGIASSSVDVTIVYN